MTATVVLRATSLEVSLLVVAQYAPFAVVGLPVGAWVDRRARLPVMIAADAGRIVVLAALPLIAVWGVLRLWQLYIVAGLVGTLTVK